MMDVYVLNKNLVPIGLIDTYKSLIWAKRYREIGDCELYLPATGENIALLAEGNYLMRLDDDMICRIKKVELDTSPENGNYLIVTGYDAKDMLDQRIIWGTANCKGSVEDFIRTQIRIAAIDTGKRQFKKADGTQLLYLAAKRNFAEKAEEQVSYKNIGEKVRELCKKHGWGYRFYLNSFVLNFDLYKGADRSGAVIFSPDYENLAESKYIHDSSKIENVALAAGEGEGSKRVKAEYGTATGIDRNEFYIDARDIEQTITYKDLTDAYPLVADGGQGYIVGKVYYVHVLDVQIVDDDQLAALQAKYPTGEIITVDGTEYYRLTDIAIADMDSATPDEYTSCKWRDVVYTVFLLNRAAEKAVNKAATVTFEGEIAPNVTYVYKTDYDLGDLVTVRNEYGITAVVRIVEIIEVFDEKGYSLQPKYEHKEVYNG